MRPSLPVFASVLVAAVFSGCVYVPPPHHHSRVRAVGYYEEPWYDYDEPPPGYYRSERRRHQRETRYHERDRRNYRNDERYAYERGRASVRNGGSTRYLEEDEDLELQRRSQPPEPAPLPSNRDRSQSQESGSKPSSSSSKLPSPQAQEKVPFGTRTSDPDRVKSPFAPYNELDVAGLKSGALAKDPTTGKIFRIP